MKKVASSILIAGLILMTIPTSGFHVSAESVGDLEKKINDLDKEQSGLNDEKII